MEAKQVTGNCFFLFIQQILPGGPLLDGQSQATGIRKTHSPALGTHLPEEKSIYDKGL